MNSSIESSSCCLDFAYGNLNVWYSQGSRALSQPCLMQGKLEPEKRYLASSKEGFILDLT